MKFTLDWLKEHLDTDASADEIGKTLTMVGLELEGMEDQIDAGPRGVKHRLAADRVDHRLAAKALDLAHHDSGLFLGERGDQGSVGAALHAVERNLHAVDPVLGLDADFLDRLVATGDQSTD